jgi:hypothetical protein
MPIRQRCQRFAKYSAERESLKLTNNPFGIRALDREEKAAVGGNPSAESILTSQRLKPHGIERREL